MYCGSRPKPAQIPVGKSDQPRPPPCIKSISINPPQTDAHETKESLNFATMRGSPLGVRSLFGSRLGVGRVARRRSGRPPNDILASGRSEERRVGKEWRWRGWAGKATETVEQR